MFNWIISEKSLDHPARTGAKLFLLAFLLLATLKAVFPALSFQSGGFIIPFIPLLFGALFFGQNHGKQIPSSPASRIACSFAGYIGLGIFLVALFTGQLTRESTASSMAIVIFLTTLEGAFAYLCLRIFSTIGKNLRDNAQTRKTLSKLQAK